jgi:hypothetical protein
VEFAISGGYAELLKLLIERHPDPPTYRSAFVTLPARGALNLEQTRTAAADPFDYEPS